MHGQEINTFQHLGWKQTNSNRHCVRGNENIINLQKNLCRHLKKIVPNMVINGKMFLANFKWIHKFVHLTIWFCIKVFCRMFCQNVQQLNKQSCWVIGMEIIFYSLRFTYKSMVCFSKIMVGLWSFKHFFLAM